MKIQKESTMYEPIREMLKELGFIVRGEVKNCDIAAVKGEELWIVEMKLSASITLLYQAMERKRITDFVYIALPRPKNSRHKNFSCLRKIVEKLELGLILVSLDSPLPIAEIVTLPQKGGKPNKKKAESVRNELLGRSIDTTGGINKSGVNTAYREKCIQIACFLEKFKSLKTRELTKMGCPKDTSSILRNNHYGWFKRTGDKENVLSDRGLAFLTNSSQSPLVVFYREAADLLTQEADNKL